MAFGWNQAATSPDSNSLAAAIRPYVSSRNRRVFTSRCMLASNFPVDAASYGYGTL